MPPLIVIVGETASGKSALGLELAEQFNGEIICADSWTVYREFDIGSGKPTPEERQHISHHLLDIADPRDGFSAAIFKGLANDAITDIAGRAKLPFLVGGTGLYIDSVIFDYGFLPAPAPALRQKLNHLSLDELLAEAARLGLSTDHIDTRNKRRVIRLIENNGVLPAKTPIRENTLVLGVAASSDELKAKITKRVDHMIEAGLEQEVRTLAERYGYGVEPMKGIGYQQWQAYFSGSQTLADTRQQIIKATLGLAKRQRTWFKRNNSIHWVNNLSDGVDIVTTFLNTLP